MTESIFWDIETYNTPEIQQAYMGKFVTDFSAHEITVLGALKVTEPHWEDVEFVQWVGEDEIKENFKGFFDGVQHTYGFNSIRFERKVIFKRLGLDFVQMLDGTEIDIMHWGYKRGLKGGLKAIEVALELVREKPPLHFTEMFDCWVKYRDDSDEAALKTLLDYNREDVYMTREVARRLR